MSEGALLEQGRVEGRHIRVVELLDRGVHRHADLARLVDEADRDRVAAEELALVELGARIDVGVGAGARAQVELTDEVFERVARIARTELVLQLGQAEHVGAGGDQGGDELLGLARQLLGGVGAPRLLADRRAGGAPGIEGGEVVEDVEAADLERAADRVGLGGPRVGRREAVVAVVDGAHPEGVGRTEAEGARQPRDGVAHPRRGGRAVGRTEAVEVLHRQVLGILPVVVGDRARRRLGEVGGVGRRIRLELVGEGLGPPAGRETDLVEAVEVELLGDREGLRDADQHALVALEVGLGGGAGADRARRRQVDRHRGGLHLSRRQRAGRHDLDRRGIPDGELRLAVEFGDGGGDADAVTLGDVDEAVAGALVDEHALRGQRVAVLIGRLLLQVEAAEIALGVGIAVLEITDDDRLDRDGAADERARRPGALNRRDQAHVVVDDGAGRGGGRGAHRCGDAGLVRGGRAQGQGEGLVGLRQGIALDADADLRGGGAGGDRAGDRQRQARRAGEVGAVGRVGAGAGEFGGEGDGAQRAVAALHREGDDRLPRIALRTADGEGVRGEPDLLGEALGQGGVEDGAAVGDLVGADEQRRAGRVAVGGDEAQHLRAEVGRGTGKRRDVGDVGGVGRIGDVVDDDAALPLQADEGVDPAVDGADGDALGLRPLVVRAVVRRVGHDLIVVEPLRRDLREDLLELAAGLAHLGDGAVVVLAEDRDAAPAQRVELVDHAVVVGIAGAQQHVEAGIGRVGLEELEFGRQAAVGDTAQAGDVAGIVGAADHPLIALVGGDEVGRAAGRERGHGIRLEQAVDRRVGGGRGDADRGGPVRAVAVGGVELVAGQGVVDRAQRLDRDRRRAGIGEIDDGDAVHLLQGDVGEAVVGRDRDVFGLDVGRRAVPRRDGEAAGAQGGLAAVEAVEPDGRGHRGVGRAARDVDDRDPADRVAAGGGLLTLVGDEDPAAVAGEGKLVGADADGEGAQQAAVGVEQGDPARRVAGRVGVGDGHEAVEDRDRVDRAVLFQTREQDLAGLAQGAGGIERDDLDAALVGVLDVESARRRVVGHHFGVGRRLRRRIVRGGVGAEPHQLQRVRRNGRRRGGGAGETLERGRRVEDRDAVDAGADVVGEDRADALAVRHGRSHDVGDRDREGLGGLDRGVAEDVHREGRAGLARRDGLAGDRPGDVVAPGGGGAVRGRDIEGDAPRGRGRVQRHGEDELLGARIALAHLYVADRQARDDRRTGHREGVVDAGPDAGRVVLIPGSGRADRRQQLIARAREGAVVAAVIGAQRHGRLPENEARRKRRGAGVGAVRREGAGAIGEVDGVEERRVRRAALVGDDLVTVRVEREIGSVGGRVDGGVRPSRRAVGCGVDHRAGGERRRGRVGVAALGGPERVGGGAPAVVGEGDGRAGLDVA